MKKILYICISAGLLFTAACGNNSDDNKNSVAEKTAVTSSEKTNDWETYSKEDFSIRFPKEWTKDDSEAAAGIQLFLYSPEDESEIIENINVVRTALPGTVKLEDIIPETESQLKQVMPDMKMIESGVKQINGRDYAHLLYEGSQYNIKMKFEQRAFVDGKTLYVLTTTTGIDTYERFKEITNDIMNTFQIM